MICLNCRKGRLQKKITDLSAEVKGEKFVVRMNALVCPACGYTTIEGSLMPEYMRLAADAYRASNGLLTGDQIRERRARLRMSQGQFAEYIGVGIASVKRWELGQVQDLAMDRLIRVMTDIDEASENLTKLKTLSATPEPTILGRPLVSLMYEAVEQEWHASKPYRIEAEDLGGIIESPAV